MDDTGGVNGPDTARPDHLPQGTRVEVRNAFDGAWSRGFTVVSADDDGYVIRRRSDDVEFPTIFAHRDVRRERKRSTWWV